MANPSRETVLEVHTDSIARRDCSPREFIDRVVDSPWWSGKVEMMYETHWLLLEEDGREIGSMPITVEEATEVALRNGGGRATS